MNIVIPKIVKKLELKEYSKEFGDTFFEVWVNPPKSVLNDLRSALHRIDEIVLSNEPVTPEQAVANQKLVDSILEEQVKCYSEILSQGDESTRMSAEELKTLTEQTFETDPGFWTWIKTRVNQMIVDHRVGIKKA